MRRCVLLGIVSSCLLAWPGIADAEVLPKGAIARLGSSWLRNPGGGEPVISFSPDGKLLAFGSMGRYLKVWSLEQKTLVHRLASKSHYGNRAIAFSPNGKHLAASSYDGFLRLWRMRDGALIWEKRRYREGKNPSEIRFFSKGDRIAAIIQQDQQIEILDAATGVVLSKIQHNVPAGSRKKTIEFAISPDDKLIAMGCWRDVEIVEVDAPHKMRSWLKCHSERISSIEFTPDGRGLLTCGVSAEAVKRNSRSIIQFDAERRLWRLSDGSLYKEYFAASPDRNLGSAFASTDSRVFGTAYGSIVVWDGKTGERLRTIEHWNLHSNWHRSFAISTDGAMLAAGKRGSVSLWDARTGQRILNHNDAHRDEVTDIEYSADGRWIASAGRDGDVRIWNSQSRQLTHALSPAGSRSAATDSVAFSPDSSRVVAAGTYYANPGFAGMLTMWQTQDGSTVRTKILDGRAKCVAFSQSGSDIILGAGQAPNPFNAPENNSPCIYLFDSALDRVVTEAASFQGKVLAIHTISGSVESQFVDKSRDLWHWYPKAKKLSHFPLEAKNDSLISAAFNADGSRLATSGLFDEKIHLWKTSTGEKLATYTYENSQGSMLAFAPDQRMLAIAPIGVTSAKRQYAKNIRIWDTSQPTDIAAELEVTMPNVSAINFAPSGKELVTGHRDGTLTIWALGILNDS